MRAIQKRSTDQLRNLANTSDNVNVRSKLQGVLDTLENRSEKHKINAGGAEGS